ncbi:hypothetical protein MUTS16_28460 [Escherichia coli]|nr:hypothetical protein MUTS16_28460 [Escherichia coli]
MKITAKIIYRLTIALMIAGSVQTAAKEKYHCLHPMMNGISFFYPNALPAQVTYVELLDTDGIYYQFRTLDATAPSSTTIGQWRDNLRVGVLSFNKAKNPLCLSISAGIQ